MKHKVEQYITKHNLLDRSKSVLVALSGGADSVALLIVLLKLDYRCEAVHCNFHLRGEESDRDEAFVREICQRYKTPLHVLDFDTRDYAKKNGISIEMAAREQRYNAFEELRCNINAGAIAVAHHIDDSAETLLLNLVRGTGIKGLRGIQPKNGYVVRPLLCVGRNDIIEYLQWRGESFVTDSTNLTSDYTRNKLRLEIIPKLAEINPSIKESIASTAQRISEAELIYRSAIAEAIKRVKKEDYIDIELLHKEIAPTTLLHEILSPLGFNSTQVENILASTTAEGGKTFYTAEWCVIKDRNKLIITPKRAYKEQEVILPMNGVIETVQGVLESTCLIFNGDIPKTRDIACLDVEKLHLPLTLRSLRQGDRFAPFGMRGTKLVSDYLTDCKRCFIEKQEQLVVVDMSGEIVWVVNERPSARCSISKDTKNIIRLRWRRE